MNAKMQRELRTLIDKHGLVLARIARGGKHWKLYVKRPRDAREYLVSVSGTPSRLCAKCISGDLKRIATSYYEQEAA